MKRVWGALAGIAALAVAGVGLWYLFTSGTGSTTTRQPPPVPVVTAEVMQGEVVERTEAIGTVNANESTVITAKVTEVVTEIRFKEGERVKKDQVLVLLSDDEQKAELAKAEADLVAANQQFNRINRLRATGTATDAQMEQVTARRAALRAEILAIRARLKNRIIRAPFAGTIGVRQVSPGALIQPGTAIATLDDLSVVKVDFSVPETFLGAIRSGQEVSVQVAAFPKRAFPGKIDLIGTRVDVATRAASARAVLPNADRVLRPGMLATISIVRARRTAIVVPEVAVVPIGNRNFVFVVEKNVVRRVQVQLGFRQPGQVEVVSGLKAGQPIVIEGTSRIRHGARVVVRQRPPAAPSGAGR